MMKSSAVLKCSVVMAGLACAAMAQDGGGSSSLTLTSTSLTFNAVAGGGAPPSQTLSVQASSRTRFTASVSVSSGGSNWLRISPSGELTTPQTLTVSVNPAGLAAGNYRGTISVISRRVTRTAAVTLIVSPSSGGGTLTLTPSALTFQGTLNGSNPPSQTLSVTASSATNFTAGTSVHSGGSNWLSISPSGALTTNRTITVSASLSGLNAGSYTGSISIISSGTTRTVPVTFVVNTTGGGGGTAFKLVGWNDLGMHCDDGKDYSVFGVLPPYNTIHAHLIDSAGNLVVAPAGYTVTYEATLDPLTNTINTTSAPKTNFWVYAAALGFGPLAPDTGLKGFATPGPGNTPRSMTFSTTDNTWLAEGIPMVNYADAAGPPYQKNYFPMMRLVAKNQSGTVVASTNIVLPISDEMTCNACHSSTNGTAAAMPAAGWVGNSNPAKDVKLNILRKHDERFKASSLFKAASAAREFSASGLEARSAIKPFLCASCHGTNALSLAGYSGVPALTVAMHRLHASVTDPATGQTMQSGTTRNTCYSCHPGPQTKCLRGAMANVTTSTGANAMECQSCHGPMNTVAVSTRQGWLEEPTCQGCHTGTATSNSGQIAYTSVFTNSDSLPTAHAIGSWLPAGGSA